MRKAIPFLLLLLLSMNIFGCSHLITSHFENPNPDFCVEGAIDYVFLCKKNYTSYFDTIVSLTFYVTEYDTYSIEAEFANAEAILEEYHHLLDKYHPYTDIVNVYSINHRSEDTVTLSQKLFDAISFGLSNENVVQIENVNLFNIALGPVLDIWHSARDNPLCDSTISLAYDVCPVPADLIDGITFPTDPDQIVMDSENLSISFLEPGMSIDLGGFGKGYASEILTDYLDSKAITYILNAGNSNVKAGGMNTNNADGFYYIALIRPEIEFQPIQSFYSYLKIPPGISVVTSGNYQRFYIGLEDGEVYHHIIDPRTNYPGGEAMSVSVVFEDGALADIYSTAIYLLSVEEGWAFVNETPYLEAIWYLSDGSVLTSEGFTPYLYQLL